MHSSSDNFSDKSEIPESLFEIPKSELPPIQKRRVSEVGIRSIQLQFTPEQNELLAKTAIYAVKKIPNLDSADEQKIQTLLVKILLASGDISLEQRYSPHALDVRQQQIEALAEELAGVWNTLALFTPEEKQRGVEEKLIQLFKCIQPKNHEIFKETFTVIHAAQRMEALDLMFPLVEGTTITAEDFQSLIWTMLPLIDTGRSNLIKLATPTLKNMPTFLEKKFALQGLSRLNIEGADSEIVNGVVNLFTGCAYHSEANTIFEVLDEFALSTSVDMKGILALVSPFVRRGISISQRATLLALFSEIPTRRQEFATYAEEVLKALNLGNQHDIHLLKIIKKISSNDRETTCPSLVKLFENIHDPDEIHILLNTLEESPRSGFASVINHAASLVTNLPTGYQRSLFLFALEKIPPKQRSNDLFRDLVQSSLIQNLTPNDFYYLRSSYIIDLFGLISPGHKTLSVLQDIISCFNEVDDETTQKVIIALIASIPEEKQASFIYDATEYVDCLMKGLENDYERKILKNCIWQILMPKTFSSGDSTFADLELIAPICDSASLVQRGLAAAVMRSIPPENKTKETARQIVAHGTSLAHLWQIDAISYATTLLPPEQRTAENIGSLCLFFKGIESYTYQSNQEIKGFCALERPRPMTESPVIEKAFQDLSFLIQFDHCKEILDTLAAIPNQRMLEVINDVLSWLSMTNSIGECLELLAAMEKVSIEKKALAKQILQTLSPIPSLKNLIFLLKAITMIPIEQLNSSTFQAILDFIRVENNPSDKELENALEQMHLLFKKNKILFVEVIQQAVSLSSGNLSTCNAFLQVLSNIPNSQRKIVLDQARQLWDGMNSGLSLIMGSKNVRVRIVTMMAQLTPQQRTAVIERATAAKITTLNDDFKRLHIINIFCHLSVEQVSQQSIDALVTSLKEAEIQDLIFTEDLLSLSPIKTVETAQEAILFFKTNKNVSENTVAFNIASIFPTEQINLHLIKELVSRFKTMNYELTMAAKSIFNYLQDPQKSLESFDTICNFLKSCSQQDLQDINMAFKWIPRDRILAIIGEISTILKQTSPDIVSQLGRMSQEQRDALFSYPPLIEHFQDLHPILEVLFRIPAEHIPILLQRIMPPPSDFTDADLYADQLELLYLIPQKEFEGGANPYRHLILFIDALFMGNSTQLLRNDFLKILKSVPIDERMSFIDQAFYYLSDTTEFYEQHDIVFCLSTLTPKQRSALGTTLDLKGIAGSQRGTLLKIIGNLRGDYGENRELETRLIAWIRDLDLSKFPISMVLEKLPIKTITAFLDLFENTDDAQQEQITRNMMLLSPTRRANFLLNEPDKLKEESSKLFEEDTLVEESRHYLYDALGKTTDPTEASWISYYVLNAFNELKLKELDESNMDQIGEEALLYNAAVTSQHFTSEESLRDLTTPYTLYDYLQHEERTMPPLRVDLDPSTISEIGEEGEVLWSEKAAWDLDGLRSIASKRVKFTVDDLPKDIGQDILENMFKDFSTRVNGLMPDQKQAAENAIADTGMTIESARDSLLDDTKEIPKLLKVEGESSDRIENIVYYLYKIIQALKDESNELKPGCLLTPREEMLLALANSINACKIGQKDGITIYYNNLPLKYRLKEKKTEEYSLARFGQMMDQAFLSTIHDGLASDKTIKSLSPDNDLTQQSHDTLFLQNRLVLQIGDDHDLAFDPYSNCINPTLINTRLEALIKGAMQNCSIDTAVVRYQNAIAEGRKNNDFSYHDLETYVSGILPSEKKVAGWQGQYLAFNDDYTVCTGLTKAGALAVLKAAHYLKT